MCVGGEGGSGVKFENMILGFLRIQNSKIFTCAVSPGCGYIAKVSVRHFNAEKCGEKLRNPTQQVENVR
jgi:hypothetical protein